MKKDKHNKNPYVDIVDLGRLVGRLILPHHSSILIICRHKIKLKNKTDSIKQK